MKYCLIGTEIPPLRSQARFGRDDMGVVALAESTLSEVEGVGVTWEWWRSLSLC